jgi:LuxR family maltose regulon positive regulatory protein
MSAFGATIAMGGYAERFTPRELTIVELLPTHLNYAQIGDELYVSINTVKSNVKSIYRKLGVTSRHEAVIVARELGLI